MALTPVTRMAVPTALFAAIAMALVLSPAPAAAQELDPGAYWPIPVTLNVITISNAYNWGDLAFDPSVPIDKANARINTTAISFTRAFSLAGRSANVTASMPVVGGHLEGLYLGQPAAVDRFGLADPRVRLAVNLYGAPAMSPREFGAYQQYTLVGVSLTVAPPLGQYDPTKLINIGNNRWAFKPEVGLSRTNGHWVLEGMVGGWFFTGNTDFYGGGTRQQQPIGAVQAHLTYKFKRTVWLAGDANYYTGGRTTINGKANVDLQKNSRVGATFSAGIDRHQAIRASVSKGAVTTVGADFWSIAVGYNYAWTR
jgi:hypothetical protein